eukprot:maker-scaffold_1-snap-gene-21.51-mRNA-1 protein AED:0.01 eAED:0.10 QI:0/0/0.5/1/1/1/2/120/589
MLLSELQAVEKEYRELKRRSKKISEIMSNSSEFAALSSPRFPPLQPTKKNIAFGRAPNTEDDKTASEIDNKGNILVDAKIEPSNKENRGPLSVRSSTTCRSSRVMAEPRERTLEWTPGYGTGLNLSGFVETPKEIEYQKKVEYGRFLKQQMKEQKLKQARGRLVQSQEPPSVVYNSARSKGWAQEIEDEKIIQRKKQEKYAQELKAQLDEQDAHLRQFRRMSPFGRNLNDKSLIDDFEKLKANEDKRKRQEREALRVKQQEYARELEKQIFEKRERERLKQLEEQKLEKKLHEKINKYSSRTHYSREVDDLPSITIKSRGSTQRSISPPGPSSVGTSHLPRQSKQGEGFVSKETLTGTRSKSVESHHMHHVQVRKNCDSLLPKQSESFHTSMNRSFPEKPQYLKDNNGEYDSMPQQEDELKQIIRRIRALGYTDMTPKRELPRYLQDGELEVVDHYYLPVDEVHGWTEEKELPTVKSLSLPVLGKKKGSQPAKLDSKEQNKSFPALSLPPIAIEALETEEQTNGTKISADIGLPTLLGGSALSSEKSNFSPRTPPTPHGLLDGSNDQTKYSSEFEDAHQFLEDGDFGLD